VEIETFVSSRNTYISEFAVSRTSRECELSVMLAFEVGDLAGNKLRTRPLVY
jgi:hypothetical protein